MTATALPSPVRTPRRTEVVLARIAIALIALHVLDDSFIQPNPGTSALDHLAGGLIPTALLALAAYAYPRLRGTGRGWLAAAVGVFGITAGIEALYYAQELGPTGDDFTGLLAMPAGLALLASAPVTLWRTRRTDGSRPRRYGLRAGIALAVFLAVQVIAFPVGLAYVVTHTARAVVPENELGVAYEDVS